MLRGDWLNSQKGVRDATTEKRLAGEYSACDDSPGLRSCCEYAIRSVVCSSGPI